MSSQVTTEQETPLNFTENAARKIYDLMQDEPTQDAALRVYITGGGCSGFQYGFTFDEKKLDDDITVTRTITVDKEAQAAVQLWVDAMSFQYLKGADIDYQEDLEGARFVIRNPNAKTTCGCGSSFEV